VFLHPGFPRFMFASPNFEFERAAHSKGFDHVCGVDEAGRGPLAGPVVAAAVVLDPDSIPPGLNDSKALTEARREALFDEILATAHIAIASSGATTIDAMNIRAASLNAMSRAVGALQPTPQLALIDGNAIPSHLPCKAQAIVKGDAKSLSIAAASIIAKVTRDRMMVRAERLFPGYGFARGKGYPTAAHRTILANNGPCPLHRKSFAPVREAMKAGQ